MIMLTETKKKGLEIEEVGKYVYIRSKVPKIKSGVQEFPCYKKAPVE